MTGLSSTPSQHFDPPVSLGSDGKIIFKRSVPKLMPGYTNDCSKCFGFGMWPGEPDFPVYPEEAVDGFESDACGDCGEDNTVYAYLYEQRQELESNSNEEEFVRIEELSKSLEEFEKSLACAESLDM